MSRQAIDDGHHKFVAGVNANDIRGMLATLSDDVVFMPPNQPSISGRDAVKTWLEGLLRQFKTSEMSIAADREVVVSGEWAFERGSFIWNLDPIGVGAPIHDRGNFLAIWQRQQDGSWKVARDIWNSTQSLTGTT